MVVWPLSTSLLTKVLCKEKNNVIFVTHGLKWIIFAKWSNICFDRGVASTRCCVPCKSRCIWLNNGGKSLILNHVTTRVKSQSLFKKTMNTRPVPPNGVPTGNIKQHFPASHSWLRGRTVQILAFGLGSVFRWYIEMEPQGHRIWNAACHA